MARRTEAGQGGEGGEGEGGEGGEGEGEGEGGEGEGRTRQSCLVANGAAPANRRSGAGP